MKKFLMCTIFLGISLSLFANKDCSSHNSFDFTTYLIIMSIVERLLFSLVIFSIAEERKIAKSPWVICGLVFGGILVTLLLTIFIQTPKQMAIRRLAIEEEYKKLKNEDFK